MIPYSQENQFVEAYKQSRRREDDIAIVNAGFNVTLDGSVPSIASESGSEITQSREERTPLVQCN